MNNESFQYAWFNFKKDDFVYLGKDHSFTDEEALEYLPQQPAATGLFKLHRKMGKSVTEAMEQVLRAATGG